MPDAGEYLLRARLPEVPSLRRAEGLTLIEVLLAFAILGIGLTVIMQGIATGLQARRLSAESHHLALVAANRLDHLLAAGEAPAAAEEGREAGFDWRTEPTAAPSDGEGGDTVLATVTITVTSTSGRTLQVTTLAPRSEEGE